MSITTALDETTSTPVARKATGKPYTPVDFVFHILDVAASLKVTVALLVYATWVVWIGTLAQTDADIWEVVDKYFHSVIMPVDLHLLMIIPKMAFPNLPILDPNKIIVPMPGGWIVGLLMIVNLAAAHGRRFKAQASGIELVTGLAIIGIGVVLTTLVVLLGNMSGGFQALPWFSWAIVAYLMVGSALLFWGAGAFYLGRWLVDKASTFGIKQWLFAGIWIGVEIGLPIIVVYCLFTGNSLGTESLRILWQLLQGGLASAVLLVGCWLAFRKRAGVVLLHGGIGLMMLNELLVGRYAVEWQVFLPEGETSNYFRDIRTTELAIITPIAGTDDDNVTVIPREILLANKRANEQRIKAGEKPLPIADSKDLLPFDVAVVDYQTNADVRDLKPGEKTLATTGRGLREIVVPLEAGKGTDMESSVDMAAAYVQLTEKKTGKDLGTYLLSQLASEQKNAERFAERVKIGDDEHQLFIRFQRAYQPYSISLVDVRKDDYLGSDTPRNYSSDVILRDPKLGVDEKVHIKMNDPLRYAGVTFYQSGWSQIMEGGKPVEATTLQVVFNRGWMIPYVACMIVATGMLAHFLIALGRFLGRDQKTPLVIATPTGSSVVIPSGKGKGKSSKRDQEQPALAASNRPSWITITLCASVAVIFFAVIGGQARPQRSKPGEFQLVTFGELPLAHRGRVKPIDTYARNTLRTLSMREQIKDAAGNNITAVRWFLDVVTGKEEALSYKVFRIDDEGILKLFEIEREKGNLYSALQLRDNINDFQVQVEAARKLDKDYLNPYQANLLQLDQRLQAYMSVVRSFSPPNLPPLPSPELFAADREAAARQMQEFRLALLDETETLRRLQPPLAIVTSAPPEPKAKPPAASDRAAAGADAGRWKSYPEAWLMAFVTQRVMGQQPDEATLQFDSMLEAYRNGEVANFNSSVTKYKATLAADKVSDYEPKRTAFEAYFNQFSPFFYGTFVYVVVFVLAIAAILFRSKPLNSAAFTLLVLTFLLHTFALVARIYISGRPPVTNLYSSAIFIGWGCVALGIAVELIFRLGVGNLAGSVLGYCTLYIAYQLAAGGDTIEVLQAVLDTQFWLATHVVCITMGYVATFFAGVLGVVFVILGLGTPMLDSTARKDLGRMMYGVTCFAIFFSFVGTVLGGLWADDSWGRFWGWDPKENGALMIVLWNAVVLHARWDKMVTDRGLAVLCILGNVVTAWSWFGVNELGVGLHSYGFTDGTMLRLVMFALSQFALAGLGCVPLRMWFSVVEEKRRLGNVVNAEMVK